MPLDGMSWPHPIIILYDLNLIEQYPFCDICLLHVVLESTLGGWTCYSHLCVLSAQVEPTGLAEPKGDDEDGWIPSTTALKHKLQAKAEARQPACQVVMCAGV